MLLVLLHNTDVTGKLKAKEKIEKTQMYYIKLLNKYLKLYFSSDDTNKLLHKAIMLIHDTKRIAELSEKRLKL